METVISSLQSNRLTLRLGAGTSVRSYIMGYALTGEAGWNMGYRYIALLQIVLTAILFLGLLLWKNGLTNIIALRL